MENNNEILQLDNGVWMEKKSLETFRKEISNKLYETLDNIKNKTNITPKKKKRK